MRSRQLRVVGVLIATVACSACGGGTRVSSVPTTQNNNVVAPRSMSERARRVTERLSAVQSESVETHIQREAAKGARVFRVKQVAVVDPVTHAYYVVPREDVKQAQGATIISQGPNKIVLSSQAKISPVQTYGYIFRHGAERDPDPSSHAERIR